MKVELILRTEDNDSKPKRLTPCELSGNHFIGFLQSKEKFLIQHSTRHGENWSSISSKMEFGQYKLFNSKEELIWAFSTTGTFYTFPCLKDMLEWFMIEEGDLNL